MAKKLTTIRLSQDGYRLLQALSESYGTSQTAIIEIAVREKAKREKVTPLQDKGDAPSPASLALAGAS